MGDEKSAHHIDKKTTYPARSDETDFLTRHGLAGDGGRLTNVLMVTTTVRMVNRVHRHTTSTRPAARQRISNNLCASTRITYL
jgi:hypothetical protein